MDKQTPPWFKPFINRIVNSAKPLDFFQALVKNNDIARLPYFKNYYLINDPEAIYKILLTNKDNYTKVGTSYERIENAMGKGLLTTSGEEWATRRQKYQPLFHEKSILNTLSITERYTEFMLTNWAHKQGKINISDELLALVMNISSEAFLGIDVSERSIDLVKMVHIMHVYVMRNSLLWKWLPTLWNAKYQIAKQTIDNLILGSIKTRDPAIHPLLEQLFAQDDEGKFVLPENEILGEVKTFFIAGHETTGNAISWTLYCLAKNPYVLTQVKAELDQHVGQHALDFETINKLDYFNQVIQESLRFYPVIWLFTRKSIEDDVLGKYRIPGGSIVNISPYLIHRHPKYWNQPDIFYPERFNPDVAIGRQKCAYIPFGFGPQACIGRQFALMNMKLILAKILQRFTIALPHQNYTVEPMPLISLKPSKSIILKVQRR